MPIKKWYLQRRASRSRHRRGWPAFRQKQVGEPLLTRPSNATLRNANARALGQRIYRDPALIEGHAIRDE